MGNKVNPRAYRQCMDGSVWDSCHYGGKWEYSVLVYEDYRIRLCSKEIFGSRVVTRVVILRGPNKLTVDLYSSKPSAISKNQGAALKQFKSGVEKIVACSTGVVVNVIPIQIPGRDARELAAMVVASIEMREKTTRAIDKGINTAKEAGVSACMIMISGRLDGAEIARSEKKRFGAMGLHTLSAKIDYACAVAHTIYGTVSVKIWMIIC